MKILSALFFGMGIGYMNLGRLIFLIPMGLGLILFVLDEILEIERREVKKK